ncbi:hypothetical protein THAOC_17040 [Thalassiosira oceanica]|uniref:Uncharacterized protein n=1 Tax=Thalassiosira oceanica TaxID=159749 RepID=K0SN29_THAOC|nr:hypothetical protein THAOC_17040 [Thalassiosira oceanica]|eukprot:EJK62351.1 hypothetical protein THAOC_17040 [Thalassiosira oceanica]
MLAAGVVRSRRSSSLPCRRPRAAQAALSEPFVCTRPSAFRGLDDLPTRPKLEKNSTGAGATGPAPKVKEELDRCWTAIMAPETARQESNADATGLPPNNVGAQDEENRASRGGPNVGSTAAAAPLVQEVHLEGTTASTIDDGPSIPLSHVVDHGEEAEGPQLHDGPPGPPSFPHEFDDSLAKRVENESQRSPSDHARDDALHSTMGGSVASAAAVGPSMLEGAGVGRVSIRGSAPSTSPHTEAEVATAAVNRPSEGSSTYIAEAYTVEGDTVYEAELAEPQVSESRSPQANLPFYQRKGYASVMTVVALLAIGTAAGVLLSNNSDRNSGRVKAPSDESLLPVPGQGGAAPQTSSPSEDHITGQTASKYLAPSSAPATFFDIASVVVKPTPAPSLATADRETTVPTISVPASNPKKNPTLPPTSIPASNPTNLLTRPPESTLNSSMKLLAPDGAENDDFGHSTAIYQDTIVVGAFGDGDNGELGGSAHVFVRSGGEEWKHQAKLLAPDGAGYDAFGQSHTSLFGEEKHGLMKPSFWRQTELWVIGLEKCAIYGISLSLALQCYGDTIVVGASSDNDCGDDSGSAHVFVRSGVKWTHQAKLLAPDGAKNDYFGWSLAIHEDTIVVGAWSDDDNGYDSGSAHVFVRSKENWSHQAKLLAPDGAEGDEFGRSVTIYDNSTVVGAWRDDDNGGGAGSAHVFVRSGEEWTHQAKLLALDGAAGDQFGRSVAFFGDTIAVGSPGDDDNGASSGSAHVFARNGEEWLHQVKLLAPDGAANDRFGESVANNENTIVVGAPWDDDNGEDSGSSHVFVVQG